MSSLLSMLTTAPARVRTAIFAAAACASVLLTGCATQNVPTAEKMAPFATFAVESATSPALNTNDSTPPAIANALADAIQSTLIAKGYTVAAPKARVDFVVRYTVSAPPPRSTAAGASPPATNANASFDAAATGDSVSFSFIDAEGHLLWRPSVGFQGELRTLPAQQVRELVAETLAPLPSKAGTPVKR
ncbi:MAG: hypothetical protein LBT53_00190 [Puniceicoccales bacterium]|nr:hypothetical protein [Puniceicoccales bacterium]